MKFYDLIIVMKYLIVLYLVCWISSCASTNSKPEMLKSKIWNLKQLNRGNNLQEILENSKITAEFQEGKIHGTAGCNNYFSAFNIKENIIEMGPVGATRKMCHSPEGIMEQEMNFFEALEEAYNFEIKTNQLIILNDKRKSILIFD